MGISSNVSWFNNGQTLYNTQAHKFISVTIQVQPRQPPIEFQSSNTLSRNVERYIGSIQNGIKVARFALPRLVSRTQRSITFPSLGPQFYHSISVIFGQTSFLAWRVNPASRLTLANTIEIDSHKWPNCCRYENHQSAYQEISQAQTIMVTYNWWTPSCTHLGWLPKNEMAKATTFKVQDFV